MVVIIDPPPSRVRQCLILGFTSHVLKIRQQTTVFTQRIHMNTKLSTTISYSLNNLLHYVCVPVHKKKTTTAKPHGFKENVKTFTLIIPEIGKIALFFNQNCLTAEVSLDIWGYQALAWVLRFLFSSCTSHNASTSLRTQAMKLHRHFYHFKYSLRVDKNIWGEYSSFFKPST